jgi:hypothetical protein
MNKSRIHTFRWLADIAVHHPEERQDGSLVRGQEISIPKIVHFGQWIAVQLKLSIARGWQLQTLWV